MSDLLVEITDSSSIEICEDVERGERINFLRGILGWAGKPNQNKRIYPIDVMRTALTEAQPLIASRRFLGEIDHPTTPKINMDRIAVYFPKLELKEDGSIYGEAYPTSTPSGEIIRGLMKDKIPVGFSTRATGSVKPYVGSLGEGLVEVQPGMKLVAIDAVMNPSVKDAFPEMVNESHIYMGQTTKFREVWSRLFE